MEPVSAALGISHWLVGLALDKLKGNLLKAWADSHQLGDKVGELKVKLELAEGLLAVPRQREFHNEGLAKSLRQLRELAYEAEDVLDELDYFRIQDDLERNRDAADDVGGGLICDPILHACHVARDVAGNWLPSCSSCLPPLSSITTRWLRFLPNRTPSPLLLAPKLKFNRVEMATRMQSLVDRLEPICQNAFRLLQLEGHAPVHAVTRPPTGSTMKKGEVFGRDEIRDHIINEYLTSAKYGSDTLSVVPIVGPGGFGKTTLAQYVYNDPRVQEYFDIKIWVCVSLDFDVPRLTREILKCILKAESQESNNNVSLGENFDQMQEDIKRKLKSKKFLLVLDDIWDCKSGDRWDNLLAPFEAGQQKGNMIIVTTRKPLPKLIKTTKQIDLEGLERSHFWHFFLTFIFGDHQEKLLDQNLLNIGKQIIQKLKGSPLAVKTVGGLLRGNLNEKHWGRVLESKEWESREGDDDIMPALKLSYIYLPSHLQRCFAFCGLFPDDYEFREEELIRFWIGLGILNSSDEGTGLRYIKGLVDHGFFKEEGTDHYVMHDLLRELALKISSHECLSIDCSNAESVVAVPPSVLHLSIIIKPGQEYDENFKKLTENFKPKNLRTLMLFGSYDESFVHIFQCVFRETNGLRVLHLPKISDSLESLLYKFENLLHLRYLRFGSDEGNISLSKNVSRFYHLKVIDLFSWKYDYEPSLPPRVDMSNLLSLHHFIFGDVDLKGYNSVETSTIPVETFKSLDLGGAAWETFPSSEKWPLFNRLEISGFSHVKELGIKFFGNLHFQNLKLLVFMDMPELEKWFGGTCYSFPHLEALQICGCSKLKELSFSSTQEGYTACFPRLRTLVLEKCPQLSSLPPMPFTSSLSRVHIFEVLQFEALYYTGSSEEVNLEIRGSKVLLDKVLAFHNLTELQYLCIEHCPFPTLQDLQKLQSLECLEMNTRVHVEGSRPMIPAAGERSDTQFQLPIESLEIHDCDVTGKELSELLSHLPALSSLMIRGCKKIKMLGMEEEEEEEELVEKMTPSFIAAAAASSTNRHHHQREGGEDGLLLLPSHLATSLRELHIDMMVSSSLATKKAVGGRGGLQGLCSLRSLEVKYCYDFLSSYCSMSDVDFHMYNSCYPFPSSLQELSLDGSSLDMPTALLSNITSLTNNLTRLCITGLPNLFSNWESSMRASAATNSNSSRMQHLETDDAAGLLVAPICSRISSSLSTLVFSRDRKVQRFTDEQEKALQLLTSLQELGFYYCEELQSLPEGLHTLHSLKKLKIKRSTGIRSLPPKGLPSSLQELHVYIGSEELKEQCKKLQGIIPNIIFLP